MKGELENIKKVAKEEAKKEFNEMVQKNQPTPQSFKFSNQTDIWYHATEQEREKIIEQSRKRIERELKETREENEKRERELFDKRQKENIESVRKEREAKERREKKLFEKTNPTRVKKEKELNREINVDKVIKELQWESYSDRLKKWESDADKRLDELEKGESKWSIQKELTKDLPELPKTIGGLQFEKNREDPKYTGFRQPNSEIRHPLEPPTIESTTIDGKVYITKPLTKEQLESAVNEIEDLELKQALALSEETMKLEEMNREHKAIQEYYNYVQEVNQHNPFKSLVEETVPFNMDDYELEVEEDWEEDKENMDDIEDEEGDTLTEKMESIDE